MPVETGRTTKRKSILLPSGTRVNIPVITQITFKDPLDRGQEIQFTVDNSAQGGRSVHVVNLHGNVDGDTSQVLKVERIDMWPVLDLQSRGQETQNSLDNVTGEDASPYPHFETHFQTHNVTYTSALDSQAAIITEVIDELRVLDPLDRGQETRYVLTNNPAPGTYTLGDDDPDISDTDNGIDPPWRTDPFQNIVAWRDTMGHPPPPWYGLYPSEALALIRWNPAGGDICAIEDQPARTPGLGNFGRPLTYGLCDWPIPDPLPSPFVVDWSLVSFSAGTVYKKRSEFETAFANTRAATNIAWHFGRGGEPNDTALAEGALVPELNTYMAAWYDRKQDNPLYAPWPEFRVFFVEDDHWETWMAGIHDLHDLPTA